MAEITRGGGPPPSLRRIHSIRHLLRHSLRSFLSALLLLAFRSAIYFAALRLLTLAVSDDPSLHDLLNLTPGLSLPPPPPPLGHFTHIPSLEPHRVFSTSIKSSPPSNSSFYYPVSTYNYVKIPVPALLTSPFFFTSPPETKSEGHSKDSKRPSFKEIAFFMGICLLSLMPTQALFVKWCEVVLCGSFARFLMVKIGGRFFGGFVCAIVEIYFMVAWLNFYLSVRCKEAELEGKIFELKDLEDLLDYVKVKS